MEPESPTSHEADHSVIGSAGRRTPGKSESATNAGSSRSAVKMRRHRVVLSCKPCHMHKQKCDRQLPCTRCIKRGDPALCIYEKPGPDTITVMRPGSNESSDLAQRVAQLESLVQASLGGQAPVPPHLQVSVSGSSRASDSAVQVAAAALGELSQQQDRMQDIEDNRIAKPGSFHNDLTQRVSEELLTFFFEYSSFPWLWHVIHRRFFDRSYLAFISRPESVGADFAALLSAVCASALQLMPVSHQGSSAFPNDSSNRLMLKLRVFNHAQSILASETSQPFSMERIQGLMVLAIYYLNEGSFWSCYNLTGLAVRGAQFVGMHRDPAAWPQMGPDEVEVRRRLWAGLCVLDRKVSMLLKRPYIIQDIHCTILPPANADEHTITTGASVMAKPMSESTSHTFHILQLDWTKTTRRLADECFGSTRPSYSAILSIERETLQFEAQIPRVFLSASEPTSVGGASMTAPRFQALFLSMDICYARLILTRCFAFSSSSSDAEGHRGLSKEERNKVLFEASARELCAANCKRLISTITTALNEWRKDVSQHLRWMMLILYTFDAALALTLCTLKHFALTAAHDASTWVSLTALALRGLCSFIDNPVAKNALTLTEALLAKLDKDISRYMGSPHSAAGLPISEGLDLAVRTLREERPTMDGLLRDCRDSDELWLTTTASVFEAYYPGPEGVSTLDLPAFEHFLNSCAPR